MHFKHLTSLFQSKLIRSSGGVVDTLNSSYPSDPIVDPTFGLSTTVLTESGSNQTVQPFTTSIDSLAGLSIPDPSQWLDTLPVNGGGIGQAFGDNGADTATFAGMSTGGWRQNTSDQGVSTVPTADTGTGGQTPLSDTFNTAIGHDPYPTHSTGGIVVENPNAGVDSVPSPSHFLFDKKGENFLYTGASSSESTGNVSKMSIADAIHTNNITLQTGNVPLSEFDFQHVRERSGFFGSPHRTMSVDIGKEIRKFGQTSGESGGVVHQLSPDNTIAAPALSDGNYLTSNDINLIVQSMNSYAASHDIAITSIESVKANSDLMTIVTGGWDK